MPEPGRPSATDEATQAANALYALGRSEAESARLQRQSDELAPDSRALLDRVDLRPGQRAIDVGCGPRGIADLLMERVSPDGEVVCLDAEPVHTAMLAEFAAARGLSNVRCLTADARRTGLPSDSFDLVHARTLLINVPAPEEIVAEMTRLARPGGWVAAMEPDSEYAMCHPPHAAFTRMGEIFPLVAGRNGADLTIGRRVPQLFRDAELTDVGLEVRLQMYPPGHSRRANRVDLVRSMRPHIIEAGVADEAELMELDRAVRAHLDDPTTVAIFGFFFLVWGRKPG